MVTLCGQMSLSSGGTLTREKCHDISRHLSLHTFNMFPEDCHHHVGKGRILLHPCTFGLQPSALRSFLKILFIFLSLLRNILLFLISLKKMFENPTLHDLLQKPRPFGRVQHAMCTSLTWLDTPHWHWLSLSKLNLQLTQVIMQKPYEIWMQWHFSSLLL